ncbi:unnamed protein product, partial [Brachionus calyciflorus]
MKISIVFSLMLFFIKIFSAFGEVFQVENSDKCLRMISVFIKTLNEQNSLFFKIESILIHKFNSFSQLDFSCINTDFGYIFHISPEKKLILNSQLDIHLISFEKKNYGIGFKFNNLLGFDLNSNIFEKILKSYEALSVSFYYSKFTVYSNKTFDNSNINFFQYTSSVSFSFSTKYEMNTNQLIFENCNIDNLYFYGLSDNFLKRNILSFKSNSTRQLTNSNIETLNLKSYHYNLDKFLIEPEIFKNLKYLILDGFFKSINKDLFYNLGLLKVIILESENFRPEYFEWFSNLNLSQYLFLNFKIKDSYNFPYEDFCFYKDYSFSPNILFYLTMPLTNCSCTLAWIFKTYTSNMSFYKK